MVYIGKNQNNTELRIRHYVCAGLSPLNFVADTVNIFFLKGKFFYCKGFISRLSDITC